MGDRLINERSLLKSVRRRMEEARSAVNRTLEVWVCGNLLARDAVVQIAALRVAINQLEAHVEKRKQVVPLHKIVEVTPYLRAYREQASVREIHPAPVHA